MLQEIDSLPSRNHRDSNDTAKGEMMKRTHTRLTEFYQIFNDKLAELLNDTRFKWL